MNIFITYGNYKYERQKNALVKMAKKSDWFDTVTAYGPSDLDDNFISKFKYILEEKKGAGYWIWKPYIISKKLDEINDGDILIYLDAGCELNLDGKQRFQEYIEIVKNSKTGILSFELYNGFNSGEPLLEKNWNNEFLFKYFKINNDSSIRNTPQLVGGIIIMRKCKNVIDIFTNSLNLLNDKPDFFKNCKRNDQSILSVIRKIHGTELLPDETFFKESTKLHPLGWDDPFSKQFPFHAKRNRG
tara:strand:+ start:409 stop:1140 length:732 start_codon:yes stop_codon:yes gene_type:complete